MKSHPILVSFPMMVNAIVEGRKTQTRRIMRPQPVAIAANEWGLPTHKKDHRTPTCPFGMPGDELWVMETWQHSNYPYGPLDEDCTIFYRADYLDDPHGLDGELSPEGRYRFWQLTDHMPRWASRITLCITNIRVQRLQDISETDVLAEGCADYAEYRELWEQINGSDSWDVNPWVWVLDFEVVKAENRQEAAS